MRSPHDLRAHPEYERLGIRAVTRRTPRHSNCQYPEDLEPISITPRGTIIHGYVTWEITRQKGYKEIRCLEHAIDEDEALRMLVVLHQRKDELNQFCRILLALELEDSLRSKARKNQAVGGRLKGSTGLTELQRVDVRREVADIAGVSEGNVNKARLIRERGAPQLIQAVRDGELTLNLAAEWLKQPNIQLEQLERFRDCKGLRQPLMALLREHTRNRKQDLRFEETARSLCELSPQEKEQVRVLELKLKGKALIVTSELRSLMAKQGTLI
jgi:hypothetical protein